MDDPILKLARELVEEHGYAVAGVETPEQGARRLGEGAILVALQPRAPGRRPYGPELTPRELEVAGLLAAGVTTDRELARRLLLSGNTVKYHVRNLQRKLGARDRAQVVARLLRAEPTPR